MCQTINGQAISINEHIHWHFTAISKLFIFYFKQTAERTKITLNAMQRVKYHIKYRVYICGLFSWRCIKLVAHTYRSKTVPRISLGFLYLFYYCSLIFSKISIAIFSFQILKLLLLMLVSKEYWQKMGINWRSLRLNFTHQPWPLHHIPVESSVNRTITKHI